MKVRYLLASAALAVASTLGGPVAHPLAGCTVNAGWCSSGGKCTVNTGTCENNGNCTINLRYCSENQTALITI
jgi:hypothetical protein